MRSIENLSQWKQWKMRKLKRTNNVESTIDCVEISRSSSAKRNIQEFMYGLRTDGRYIKRRTKKKKRIKKRKKHIHSQQRQLIEHFACHFECGQFMVIVTACQIHVSDRCRRRYIWHFLTLTYFILIRRLWNDDQTNVYAHDFKGGSNWIGQRQ